MSNRAMLCANWKMNGSLSFIEDYFSAFGSCAEVAVSFFVPFVYLSEMKSVLAGGNISWGGQNVSEYEAGAHTGEISTSMLKEFGVTQALVGHSERRNLYLESSEAVANKFFRAQEDGIMPVLCVGETLEERENGTAMDVISKQCDAVLEDARFKAGKFVIAYEPVWAIGTGKVPEVEDIQQVHSYIRKLVEKCDKNIAKETPILYGGSLNIDNASAILAAPDVDGGLVGGASLKVESFKELVRICKKYC